jgi:tRNA-Thr(GGU) m(6)t(6)A37 methyltransferase TsaA
MSAKEIELRPIAVVRSPQKQPVDEGWGDVVAEIHVDPSLARGLKGLENFSHAVIVFWMHDASFDPAKDLVRRPRGLADLPELGAFAQRSRHRPNPIGVTTVEIVSARSGVLMVRGLDAIDGTPVLDIKPYFSPFDRPKQASEPAWVGRLMEGYFQSRKG